MVQNKRVCVIGGAGFLGTHLVKHLIETGNELLVLDNLIVGRREFIHPNAKFIWCDITHSEKELVKIFLENSIDYVFNYAAEPYVPQSYDRPLHTFDVNARGALNVINAAYSAHVSGILQVSSAEIYGDAGDLGDGTISETHPARPHSTYGASKLAIDALVQTRYRESRIPVIALRQFNCLGEVDVLHPYVIPEIYRQLQKSEVITLGNNSFRDFMYAGDAVRIATELIEKGQPGEVYNLGAGHGIKIYDLAKDIAEIMGKDVIIVPDDSKKRAWEIWHLKSDNTKIYGVVDARQDVGFEEGLRRTIEYYMENPDKWAY